MTTMDQTLSDGPGIGVAPLPGSIRIDVEGWLFRCHSYALVNQYQLLELLGRPGVDLRFSEHQTIPMIGGPTPGMLTREQESALRSIPRPSRGHVDALYRIGYPYNFAPSNAAATFVFATCERMLLNRDSWTGDGKDAGALIEKNNITVVTPSEWSRRGMIHSGIDPARIVVVPHGVDTSVFRPLTAEQRRAEREALGCANRFVFANVSALTGNKNIKGLIEAFAIVVRRYPEAMLVLKGLDSIYQSERWLQNELSSIDAYARWKACKNMSYTGSIVSAQGLAKVYQTADCYVSPYQSEGFNLPVLEASACGLPVVTPRGGCTDEFIDGPEQIPAALGDHEGDGTQWLKTTPEDIAVAMERVLLNTDGVQARSLRVGPENAARHTWKNAVDRLLGVMAPSLKGTR